MLNFSAISSSCLTTVMYHYVRPVAASAFPRLKALELADFIGQINYLKAHYNILSIETFAAALQAQAPLPERACLLTFDDGYADHYQHVFPYLVEHGLGGLFFAPKTSLIDRKLLEVNRVQFTLANHPRPESLAAEIDTMIAAAGMSVERLRAAHFAPNRFDGAEVAYTKRLLQHALPAELRSRITAELFAKHVSADESAFAEELYLSAEQAREMRSYGMEFGGHGDLHLWHGLASPRELAQEIAGSVTALEAIGAPVTNGYYCYPFGSETSEVRKAVAAAGFRAGFTVVPELWPPRADPLLISRLDTNDLPHQREDVAAHKGLQAP